MRFQIPSSTSTVKLQVVTLRNNHSLKIAQDFPPTDNTMEMSGRQGQKFTRDSLVWTGEMKSVLSARGKKCTHPEWLVVGWRGHCEGDGGE